MRNLKRALSLAVASVMLLGMMVVGTGAASYTDVTSDHNEEAIEVLKAVGVMIGEGDTFNPDANVTRQEMAVVLCNLMDYTVASYIGTCPFTDVAPWAEAYVAACYTNGLTAGYSATTYGANDGVTTGQAGLMLLKCLGYFQEPGDFGQDWLVETTKIGANIVGLYNGIDKGAKDLLTRNDIATMILNALEADLVEITDHDLALGTDGELTTKAVYTSRYDVGNPAGFGWSATIDNNRVMAVGGTNFNIIQFGEKLYDGDLDKVNGATEDNFYRPGFTWMYENEDIIFVPNDAAAILVNETSAGDVAKALAGYSAMDTVTGTYKINNSNKYTTATTIGDNGGALSDDVWFEIDGATSVGTGNSVAWTFGVASGETIAKAIADETADGKVIEFYDYINNDKIIDRVVVLEYAAAEVTKVSGSSDVAYTLEYVDGGSVGKLNIFEAEHAVDEIILHGDVEEGSIVTIITDADDVVNAYATEKITGVQTSRSPKYTSIVVDGTEYSIAYGVIKDSANAYVGLGNFPNSKDENNFYIDQYGCVVWTNNDDPADYVVIDDIAWVEAVGVANGDGYAEARLVFMDSTSKVVVIDTINGEETAKQTDGSNGGSDGTNALVLTKGDVTPGTDDNDYFINAIWNYDINSDGEYQLTWVADEGSYNVTKGVNVINSEVTKSNTIYVYKTDDEEWSVYTGYASAPTTTGGTEVAYSLDGGYIDFVYVDVTGGTMAKDSDVIVFLDTQVWDHDSGTDEYYEYQAAINGVTGRYFSDVDYTGKFTVGVPYNVDIDTQDGRFENADENDGTAAGSNGFADNTENGDIAEDYDVRRATDNATKYSLKIDSALDGTDAANSDAAVAFNSSTTVYIIDLDDDTLVEGVPEDIKANDLVFVKAVDSTGSDTANAYTADVVYVARAGETLLSAVSTYVSDGDTIETLVTGTTDIDLGTQDLSISGNKITVHTGITTTGNGAKQIAGTTVNDWVDTPGDNAFVVLAFEAPDGATDASVTVTVNGVVTASHASVGSLDSGHLVYVHGYVAGAKETATFEITWDNNPTPEYYHVTTP